MHYGQGVNEMWLCAARQRGHAGVEQRAQGLMKASNRMILMAHHKFMLGYATMGHTKAVQISIDEDLLARIDKDSEARRDGRSAFVRSAVRRYLREKEEARIDEELRRAYRDSAEEALAEIEPLIGSQAWPDE